MKPWVNTTILSTMKPWGPEELPLVVFRTAHYRSNTNGVVVQLLPQVPLELICTLLAENPVVIYYVGKEIVECKVFI